MTHNVVSYTIILVFKCILALSVIVENTKVKQFSGSIEYYNMEWTENDHSLKITCSSRNFNILDNVTFPRFEEKISAHFIELERCFLLEANLVDILCRINVDIANIHTLKLVLSRLSREEFPEELFFNGLSVTELELHTDIFLFDMEWMKNEEKFLLTFRSLPIGIPKLRLFHSWIENWENCDSLIELDVYGLSEVLIHEGWHFNCTKLATLRLIGVHDYKVHQRLKNGIGKTWKNIKSLTMKDCNLHQLPVEILKDAVRIEYIDFSNNFLDDKIILDFAIPLRPISENVKVLNLSGNKISKINLCIEFPLLKNFILDQNELIGEPLCILEDKILYKNLELLSLNDNPNVSLDSPLSVISRVLLNLLPKLRHLNLAVSGASHIKDVEFIKLLRLKKMQVDVKLTGRDFKDIIFSEDTYGKIIEEINDTNIGVNMTIPSKGLDCDCKHYWLARALTDYSDLLSVPSLRCSSGHEVIHEPLTNMNCVKVRDDDKVTVRKWDNHSSIHWHNKYGVDWKEIAQIASKLPSVQSLQVPDNNITSLYGAYLPDSLLTIDLRRNKISRLDSSEAALLFSQPARRVRLAGNLLICDCDNKPLLDALHQHHHQVADFYNLTCIDSGSPLHLLSSFQACLLRNLLNICGVIASLILVVALLMWRYKYRIRVYLYYHGWSLSCLSEDDLDADKPYDAFVSYSHEDSAYVMEQLLPGLQVPPYCCKVCVHFRDWTVGDWIPAQIMRSVSLSKRVIIVLSRNFANSMWGKLEFRYALSGLANNGRFKLLVLVLDDVLSIPLDAELQGYLALNTYLRCDDPLFWQRLYYAMPHRKQLPLNDYERVQGEEIDMQQLYEGRVQIFD